MGANDAALTVVIVSCVVMVQVSAVVHNVGDKSGWIIGVLNYTAWAAPIRFHVGDSLVFLYNKRVHNVLEVTEEDYDLCTTSRPLASHSDGNTTVILKTAGNHYYICGFPGHCSAGQRLGIRVSRAANVLPGSPSHSPAPSSSPLTSQNMTSSKGLDMPPASFAHAVKTDASAATAFLAASFIGSLAVLEYRFFWSSILD
eukprot:PITA_17082